MTPLVLAIVALPCVYWTEGVESKARLEAAGVTRICVAADQVENWRAAGITASAVTPADLASQRNAAGSGRHRQRRTRVAHAQPVDRGKRLAVLTQSWPEISLQRHRPTTPRSRRRKHSHMVPMRF